MTREELVDCLGTIAQSGTAKFLTSLKESKDAGADSNLIGQFGVGFYSAFLVSDRVVVSTKSPKSDKQYVWEGEANSSSFTIREETDPVKLIPRGTRLTLYLKHDEKPFAHPERIQRLVKNYSQFVSFPIYTWQEKGFTKEVEVDEDPAEVKKDEQQDVNTEEKKKKTKTVVEKYWDWELTNDAQPIWQELLQGLGKLWVLYCGTTTVELQLQPQSLLNIGKALGVLLFPLNMLFLALLTLEGTQVVKTKRWRIRLKDLTVCSKNLHSQQLEKWLLLKVFLEISGIDKSGLLILVEGVHFTLQLFCEIKLQL